MQPSSLWLCLFPLISLSSAQTPPILTFDCSSTQVGEICQNICFGVICQKMGSTLTWDMPPPFIKKRRYLDSGCGLWNRCMSPPFGWGYTCDDFPFMSVREADKGKQVNRCVRIENNNIQSFVLTSFYFSLGEFQNSGCRGMAPCEYKIAIKNADNFSYCRTKPDCKNDENEYTREGLAKPDETPGTFSGGYYRLAGGAVIFVPDGARVGDRVFLPTVRNFTVFEQGKNDMRTGLRTDLDDDEGTEEPDFGDMGDSLVVEEDRIVAEVAGFEQTVNF